MVYGRTSVGERQAMAEEGFPPDVETELEVANGSEPKHLEGVAPPPTSGTTADFWHVSKTSMESIPPPSPAPSSPYSGQFLDRDCAAAVLELPALSETLCSAGLWHSVSTGLAVQPSPLSLPAVPASHWCILQWSWWVPTPSTRLLACPLHPLAVRFSASMADLNSLPHPLSRESRPPSSTYKVGPNKRKYNKNQH
ncbi:hypothetical protein O6H91_01G102000 [Diphasiastrum complanatum]|uniref:Uncharacterized protein n=1 Tax=Diphasiastrum complanatum TaxID=34168 RepID=A0ACC2EU52_DIPCM|nr:hypothetical protein O6H91_01G102000 [Diphasiastrum complanatum]